MHMHTRILLVGTISRAVVFLSAIVGAAVFGVREAGPNEPGLWDVGLPVVNLFSRWDAGIYANIALNGYPTGNNPISGLWAMFPLYPFIMRAFGTLFFGILTPFQAVLVAGFLLSNTLFFVNLILFYKLTELILKNSRVAFVSAVFFAFWPGSLFYSCVYSESLFMSFALGAFYFLEKGKSMKSTLFGFLTGLTRSNGFLVFVPFLYSGLQKRNYWAFSQSIIIFMPYLSFNIFGYFSTGVFPIREIVANRIQGESKFLFAQILAMESGYALLFLVETLLVLIPFIWFLFSENLAIRDFFRGSNAERKDLKYWAFSFVILLMLLFYSVARNLHRYAIPILPLYWVSAMLWDRNQKVGKSLLIIMATILTVGSILFATWRWYW